MEQTLVRDFNSCSVTSLHGQTSPAHLGGATIVNMNKNERASRETLQSAVHENNTSQDLRNNPGLLDS